MTLILIIWLVYFLVGPLSLFIGTRYNDITLGDLLIILLISAFVGPFVAIANISEQTDFHILKKVVLPANALKKPVQKKRPA